MISLYSERRFRVCWQRRMVLPLNGLNRYGRMSDSCAKNWDGKMSLEEYSSSLMREDGIRVIHNVPTCVQNYSWDCGLACASMVLKFLGQNANKVYTVDLEELNCGKSIWTIDLALLMKKYGIKHRFYTITLGVDKEYSKLRFRNIGVTVTTGEAVLFQLIQDKNHPKFKEIQGLIKTSAPTFGLVKL